MVECSRVRPFGDQLGEVAEPADTTVVTYYSDVCDEVDAHFARALLHQQDTISPATSDLFLQNSCNDNRSATVCIEPPFSPPPCNPVASSTAVAGGQVCPSVDNNQLFSPPHNQTPRQLSSTETTPIPPSPSLPPPPPPPPPLPPPSSPYPPPPPMHLINPTSGQWQDNPSRPAIIYPELSRFLMQPLVDPYADAPRVPGQPKTYYCTPPPPPPPPPPPLSPPSMWGVSPYSSQQRYHSPQGNNFFSSSSPNYPYNRKYSAPPPPSYYEPSLAYNTNTAAVCDPYLPASPHPSAAVHPVPVYQPNNHAYQSTGFYGNGPGRCSSPSTPPLPPPYGSLFVHHQYLPTVNCHELLT